MTPQRQTSRNLRIGALVTVSIVVLMIFVFFIGSEQRIFSRKNDYHLELESASGLAQGNPVMLSGVTVGSVKDIFLPRDPQQEKVKIVLSVERKFAERIRQDSRARLKKLGLLAGDTYVDISPGSPELPVLPPGSLILAHKQTNVDQLIASGEDLVDNFVEISHSLKNILGRVDQGEGLLGELTQEPETKQRLTDTLLTTLNKTNALLQQVESGEGLAGKLIYDENYGEQVSASLNTSLASLQSITGNIQGSFENGTGALPALLSDPSGKQRVMALIDNLEKTSANLSAFSVGLQTGEGLVPRLLNDKPYADETLRELSTLVSQLSATAKKLNEGEGTAGKLIADPGIYESINDILIGINESRMLRWLVRNRQAKGIETRYENAVSQPAAQAPLDPEPEPVPEPVAPVGTLTSPSSDTSSVEGGKAVPTPTP